MSLFAVAKPTPADRKQTHLLQLAAVFLFIFSVLLTLAPAGRLQSWSVDYRWDHWIGFGVWLAGAALIHHQLVRFAPDREPFLFPTAALLSGWGLLAIWRLDSVMGLRQSAWLAISLLALGAGLRFPGLLVFLRRYKYVWLTSGLLLTGLTFLFGTYPGGNGPHLWLGCCGVYLQPSEPLKLLLIVYLAAYLSGRVPVSFNLRQLLPPTLLLTGLALALLIVQRDLGTASLFILIYTVVVYLASNKRRMLLASLLILLLAGITGYAIFDVVRIRVDAWLNPWLDPAGRSYQIVQSLIAVAAGGAIGRGPGLGSPGVVPVAHSDFIFASLAEESGLLGITGLLVLFALLMRSGFRAAVNAANNYQRYLAAGISAWLVMQAVLIIGGNLRLLPLTGVTLPFVSYGGSSLLTTYLAVLILILISNRGEEEAAPLPAPQPYLVISGLLLVALLALALAAGWWSTVRSDALVVRTDNPRRGIAERFVPRGALVDRHDDPITITSGEPGGYERQYLYPAISATTGYNSPVYGQAGLEAGLDALLRGQQGYPESTLWLRHLLYGQPPPGLDIRLTIDLALQRRADGLLNGHRGALVMIDSESGEILVMASHPNIDPNQLAAEWNDLIQDPGAPLLNRATQGRYPPGTALGPFILAQAIAAGKTPASGAQTRYTTTTSSWDCASDPKGPLTLGNAVAAGCPAPLVQLGQDIGAPGLIEMFTSLGFYQPINLPMPAAETANRGIGQLDLASIGQDTLVVTPLQMALAAAAVSSDGEVPDPKIVAAIQLPEEGWVARTEANSQETTLAAGVEETRDLLAVNDGKIWQVIANARSPQETLTWFVGGSLPGQEGPVLALALLLEEDDPALAQQIGQALLSDYP